MGTKIIYNPPYSPTGKALIERFFHTMKMRFLDVRKGSDYSSLSQLNDDLNKWINEYNRTIHSSLKEDENDNHTPLERYMKDIEVASLSNKSPVDYVSWLDDVFLHEITRKVNGDSTVLIENQLFDVPSVYIGIRIIIRYNPRTFEGTYLYDVSQKKKVSLKRTDRIENGKTRRGDHLLMEMTTYYGMDKNPFIKDAAVSTLFTSNDFKQMTNRLEFIISSKGIGVFLSSPGMGKTT